MDFEENEESARIINLMEDQIKLKGFSFKTRKAYVKHIKRFESFLDKEIENINNEDVRKYILFLLQEQNVSHSYANQAISAIKFLCNDTLQQNKIIDTLPRQRRKISFQMFSALLR